MGNQLRHMKVPVSKKQKVVEEKIYTCPGCKVVLSNFKDLQLNLLYECTACNCNFFVVKAPKLFFVAA
jgi:transcription elongation factor Elf1